MANEMMKAVVVHGYGDAGVLNIEQAVRPGVQPGMALIRIKTAAVNPIDWKLRSGLYKAFMPVQFPWIPGAEAAGTIEALGAVATGFETGQQVYGPMLSTYAEFALVRIQDLQLVPQSISIDEAAGVALGGLTAWAAVIDVAGVKKGQQVLVHGAAGGVGLYAVQLARWKGATVIGTASSANLEFVKSLGATEVLDYQKVRFEDVLENLDAVIDTVGGSLVERSLKAVRPGGVIATTAGMPSADIGKPKGVRVASANRAPASSFGSINNLIKDKTIRPCVGKTFALEEARQAQELCQTGHGRGRIVLHV